MGFSVPVREILEFFCFLSVAVLGFLCYNEGMKKLRQALFWDTDPAKIDLQKNAQYVIERVLDLGNDREVRWLWKFYDKKLLKKVVTNSRSLRPKAKNLWTLVLNQK